MINDAHGLYSWYERGKPFADCKKGWYEHVVHTDSVTVHCAIMDWLFANVDGVEKHCRWYCADDEFRVKFRFKKDHLWFSLSF